MSKLLKSLNLFLQFKQITNIYCTNTGLSEINNITTKKEYFFDEIDDFLKTSNFKEKTKQEFKNLNKINNYYKLIEQNNIKLISDFTKRFKQFANEFTTYDENGISFYGIIEEFKDKYLKKRKLLNENNIKGDFKCLEDEIFKKEIYEFINEVITDYKQIKIKNIKYDDINNLTKASPIAP